MILPKFHTIESSELYFVCKIYGAQYTWLYVAALNFIEKLSGLDKFPIKIILLGSKHE